MTKHFSPITTCRHCGNIAPMEIIDTAVDDTSFFDPDLGGSDGGVYYEILHCPACKETNIGNYTWYDGMESEEDINYKLIYPVDKKTPEGLPLKVLKAYQASQKVRVIDSNAYAVLLRRLLEIVCIDRKASGSSLNDMLKDLSEKGEIPTKLVKVAHSLRNFGNIGAHASIAELSEKEVPIATTLCDAILEYIYSAPHLAEKAENMLKSIKKK